MKCEHCPKEFVDSIEAIIEYTFHKILNHVEEVNGYEKMGTKY